MEGKGERSDANSQLPQNKRKQSVMTAFFVYFVIPKILPHPSFIEINFYDRLRASEKVASNLFSRLLQQLQRRGLLYQDAMLYRNQCAATSCRTIGLQGPPRRVEGKGERSDAQSLISSSRLKKARRCREIDTFCFYGVAGGLAH